MAARKRAAKASKASKAKAAVKKVVEAAADPMVSEKAPKAAKKKQRIIGVDGEGQDTPDGRHIYTYLAAVDEDGKLWAEAYNAAGLTHDECANMLLSLPKSALKFGFMFSYDVTKIIEAMPLAYRYILMRPNLRRAKACLACKHVYVPGAAPVSASDDEQHARDDAPLPVPIGGVIGCPDCGSEEARGFTRSVEWKGRKYGFFNGSLSVSEDLRRLGGKARACKVWDCFRFFGEAFVGALQKWKVGTPEQVARIYAMKNKRGAFDVEDPEAVKLYCREECHLLAVMMRKVLEAHEEAGWPLARYEGAGSTATALLKAYDVGAYRGPKAKDLDPALLYAILSAFFGGRFENSHVGRIAQPVDGFDLSSAYPYALTFLPCLECGTWHRETRVTAARLEQIIASNGIAVARFHVHPLGPKARAHMAWGPLPFRDEKGSIAYGTNFSGWAWAVEVLPALRGWEPIVELDGEAWIYETACDHRPFGFLPEVYSRRVKWGKEGAGIVLKLGPNATYGKTAQSIGEDPHFQSWAWAGMTTATTRGQILDGIASARERWNVLAIATDGIYSKEKLHLPAPRDTKTWDLVDEKGRPVKKPLGGWEHKEVPEGIFLVKPGLYYRLAAELSDIRARGVGRKEVFAERARLEKGFADWDRKNMQHAVTLTSRRFYGAKHSVYARSGCPACSKTWAGIPEKRCPSCGRVGRTYEASQVVRADGRPAYGTWDVRDVDVQFDPHPKREQKLPLGGDFARLRVRDLGGFDSAAYKLGRMTPEGEAARMGQELSLEQPDWEEEDFNHADD